MGLSERLEPVVEKIQDQLAGMSERDRRLALGLAVFVVVALVGGGIWWMKSSLDALDAKVADRRETLHRVQLLAAEYESSKAQAEEISARIGEHADTDLSAFLEQVAQKANVGDRLDSVRQKTSTDDGDLVETVYAVKLSRLLQDELAGFLYEMETAGYPLRVRTMTVKARKRSGSVELNVDLDVSSYKLSATGGEE